MRYFDWLNMRGYIFKALPLVYDNSLSYYELLQKLVNAVMELYDAVNVTPEYVTSEVERILQEMYDNGELEELIAEYTNGLRNYQGAYERDSSSVAAHNLDFFYIDSTYTGGDSDGSYAKPFVGVNEAFEGTLNRGIACPNFRFITGGAYECKYAVFNGVTIHMSKWNASARPVIHFKGNNNVTWYNSHINFSELDLVVDAIDPDDGRPYLFRGENSELHFSYCSLNTRLDIASGGMNIISCTLKSISMSNSSVVMQGDNILAPNVQNAIVCRYNSELTVIGTITFLASTYDGNNRAFYVNFNACLNLFTDEVPTINSSYYHQIYLTNGSTLKMPDDFSEDITVAKTGVTTVQTGAQVI